MTFIIGDIHGEITKLKHLINFIDKHEKNTELVFIGDYLDKGENPYETLLFLSALGVERSCTFLYGNHELVWINFQQDDTVSEAYLLKYGGLSTMKSLNVKTLWDAKNKLMNTFEGFFSQLRPFWRNTGYVAVHSGILPEDYDKPMEDIPLKDLLFNRYDFLKQETLYLNKFKVIFGHTGFYKPYYDLYKIGIDTAACFLEAQPLTAFCTEESLFIDSNDNQYKIQELLLNQCPNIARVKPWRNNDIF